MQGYSGSYIYAHGLRAEVDAELLELGRLAVLEAEHVEDADEAVRDVPHRVVEQRHRTARLPGSARVHRRGVLARQL